MAGRTGEVLCTCMCYGNTDALEPCAEVWFSVLITSVCPGSYLYWLYLFFREFLKASIYSLQLMQLCFYSYKGDYRGEF